MAPPEADSSHHEETVAKFCDSRMPRTHRGFPEIRSCDTQVHERTLSEEVRVPQSTETVLQALPTHLQNLKTHPIPRRRACYAGSLTKPAMRPEGGGEGAGVLGILGRRLVGRVGRVGRASSESNHRHTSPRKNARTTSIEITSIVWRSEVESGTSPELVAFVESDEFDSDIVRHKRH